MARVNSTKNRLYRFKTESEEAKTGREFVRNSVSLAKAKIDSCVNEKDWLCLEAIANESRQHKFPDLWEKTGNITEIDRGTPLQHEHPQGIGGEIPYAMEQEIYGNEHGIFSEVTGNPLAS